MELSTLFHATFWQSEYGLKVIFLIPESILILRETGKMS
jgi:hypothetical protein